MRRDVLWLGVLALAALAFNVGCGGSAFCLPEDGCTPGGTTATGGGGGAGAGTTSGTSTGGGSTITSSSTSGEEGGGGACAEVTFGLTELQEAFTVPPDAKYMHVKAWAGGGNDEGQCGNPLGDGGPGGYTEAVFQVLPGTSLVVMVGKGGRSGTTNEQIVKFGFGHWGGGGLSGVFKGGPSLTKDDAGRALVIAGGGGSAGAPGCNPGGPGNHPGAGGETSMQGTKGADDINGGGGGYKGGSGGAKGKAGKGGTGFVAPEAIDSKILYSEPDGGWPPNKDDPDYINKDDPDNKHGTSEQDGRVVIRFTCEIPPPL